MKHEDISRKSKQWNNLTIP